MITAAKVAQSYRNYPEVANPSGRNDSSALKTKRTAKYKKSKRVRSSESKEVHPKKKTFHKLKIQQKSNNQLRLKLTLNKITQMTQLTSLN